MLKELLMNLIASLIASASNRIHYKVILL